MGGGEVCGRDRDRSHWLLRLDGGRPEDGSLRGNLYQGKRGRSGPQKLKPQETGTFLKTTLRPRGSPEARCRTKVTTGRPG